MKLRMRRGSLRFRLTKAEVATLAERGAIEEMVEIGIGYRLMASNRSFARLEGAQITVELPRLAVREWAETEQVGIEFRQESLLVLVEKDFACLSPRAEDEDAFPNPGTHCE